MELSTVGVDPLSVDTLSTLKMTASVNSILMRIGTLGNMIVLCVQHFKCRHIAFSFFVKLLAALDLMSFLPIDIAVKTVPKLKSMNMFAACRIAHYFAYATSMSSGTVLLLIAVERYRKICQPLNHAIEPKVAKLLSAIAITTALSISSLTTMVTNSSISSGSAARWLLSKLLSRDVKMIKL